MIVILASSIYQIFLREKEVTVNDSIKLNPVKKIKTSEYTNVLKAIHENLEPFIGQKISFTGFVYRLYDFNDNQFVLARQMIISSDYQAVVVGFLCDLPNSKEYKNGCWVEVEGTIEEGEYHGKIPIIRVETIKEVNVPNEEYVYPPDESYISTSVTL